VSTPPPGWYPDPYQPTLQRYWDGVQWTANLAEPLPQTAPHPTLPFPVAIGAIVSLAVPLVASRWILRPFAHHDWPIAVYVVVAGLLAYGPPLAFWRYASRRWGSGAPAADVGLQVRAVDFGWGPLTWLAGLAAQAVVAALILALHVPFQSNTESIRALRDDRGFVIAMLVLSVVVAPLVEEIVFRGLVLRGFLSRWPVVAAVGVQGVLFGMAHFSPERGLRNIGLILLLSVAGVVLGTSAYLVRRLAPTIIAHAIINGVAMAVVLSGWSPGTNDDAAVVDQAYVAEPHGGHHHGVLVGPADGLQGDGVDQLEVLEPGQWLIVHHSAAGGHQRSHVAFAGGVGGPHGVE
jgi:membrane protease YdiL (CAAX protease family)